MQCFFYYLAIHFALFIISKINVSYRSIAIFILLIEVFFKECQNQNSVIFQYFSISNLILYMVNTQNFFCIIYYTNLIFIYTFIIPNDRGKYHKIEFSIPQNRETIMVCTYLDLPKFIN